jgi:hypothetical protein
MHAGDVRSLRRGLNTTVGQSWVHTHHASEEQSAKVTGFLAEEVIPALYEADVL